MKLPHWAPHGPIIGVTSFRTHKPANDQGNEELREA